MKDLISVIIPVYKVEEYLNKCVESILEQTYRNIEVILIDDGSPDRCGDMCNDFAKADYRVKAIHKENGGLSDARNAGIEIASGEYLTFLDSDDWVHVKYLEKLYNLLITTESDIAVCDFIRTSSEDVSVDTSNIEIYEFSNIEALEQLAGKFHVPLVTAWGKIYHKDLFREIRYPVDKVHEDEYTAHYLLFKAKRIVFTTEQLVYYRQRKDSIMGARSNLRNRIHSAHAFKDRAEFFDEIGLIEPRDKTYKRAFAIYKGIIEFVDKEQVSADIQEVICELKTLKLGLRKGDYELKTKMFFELYCLMPFIMVRAHRIYCKIKEARNEGLNNLEIAGKVVNRVAKKIVPHNLKRHIEYIQRNAIYDSRIKMLQVGLEDKRIILIGTPEHGNLGDHAIAEAELNFFYDNLSDRRVIEISGLHYRFQKDRIASYIKKSDLICITGGGFLGSLWMIEEKMVRDILSTFKDNKIIIFPQTIYFEDSEIGRREFELSKYSYREHHDLTICLRDEKSFNLAKQLIGEEGKDKLIFTPDISLYLNKTDESVKRDGILFCIREDKERVLPDIERKKMVDEVFKIGK